MMKKVLVTGCAGFIGMHCSIALANLGYEVIGTDYQEDPGFTQDLRYLRLINIIEQTKTKKFSFVSVDITNSLSVQELIQEQQPDYILHLAALTDLRESDREIVKYHLVNVSGFDNLLEACRQSSVKKIVFASTASLYSAQKQQLHSEDQKITNLLSEYGNTKYINEWKARDYAQYYPISIVGLRYFNVYGPWMRSNTGPAIFMKSIVQQDEVQLFAQGNNIRDYVYIDDVIKATSDVLLQPNFNDKNFDIFNVGTGKPITTYRLLNALEDVMGLNVRKKFLPALSCEQSFCVADTSKLKSYIDFVPEIKLRAGIAKYVSWYKGFYNI